MRGIIRLMLAGVAGAVLTAPEVHAQPAQEPRILPYGFPRNADYEQAVRFRRLQTELVYIDELEGEIPMDGLALLPPAKPEDDRDSANALSPAELSSRLILMIATIAAGLLLWRNRALLQSLLGRVPAVGAAQGHQPAGGAQPRTLSDLALIDRLRRMADREEALVLLLQETLHTAALANGLRLGRAETAREFLRRLPPGWAHLSALRRLVMAEELVQFGGRVLAEETFEQCLHDAVPILRGARVA